MRSTTRIPARPHRRHPHRIALAAAAALAVLATIASALTGADVVAADAGANPTAATVSFNGIRASAATYASSTVTLCPQRATLAVRFRDRVTGRPLRRHYTIYWSTDGAHWRTRSGHTTRRGWASAALPGRIVSLQVSANGYNHLFAVRYRACRTSVSGARISAPFGVHGDRRAHVRLSGVLHAERSNGTRVPFARGRVAVRTTPTGRPVTVLRAGPDGRFTGAVPVLGTTRLTLTPVGGPTGDVRPVAYGRRWVGMPLTTRTLWIPRWMRQRRVRLTVSPQFGAQVERYAGGFADPTVMRVGRTYVAAATSGFGLNLPLMTSRNLLTWRPRPALPRYFRYSSWPGYNDAMAQAPAWAVGLRMRENVKRVSQWAPSLARLGPHRYVAAFSAARRRTSGADRHSCLGIAVSSSPIGPYRALPRPLLCDPSTPYGVIDPDVFVDPRSHRVYLAWAAEGIPGRRRGQLAIRQLNRAGTGWARGSRRHDLLTFSEPWEGVIVENPSMIRYHGRLYLFYSANAYPTSHYATGYAICRHVYGPCTKPSRRPLMATRGAISGPGGADAFVDAYGHLRLAYAAWRRGHEGQSSGPGRVLHIAAVRRVGGGRLRVTRMSR